MPPPNWTQNDFLTQFQALLPRGRIWPRESSSVQAQALSALMPTYVRQAQRSVNLLTDAFPSTTIELLPEWESTLGLPDPCTVASPSLQQRQAAVAAKLIGAGGQSLPYYTAVAAALGFAITITEFYPFCADDACDLPLLEPGSEFYWQINAPEVVTYYFSADESFADDPLETYDATELTCRLTALAPAHTTLLFVFS